MTPGAVEFLLRRAAAHRREAASLRAYDERMRGSDETDDVLWRARELELLAAELEVVADVLRTPLAAELESGRRR